MVYAHVYMKDKGMASSVNVVFMLPNPQLKAIEY